MGSTSALTTTALSVSALSTAASSYAQAQVEKAQGIYQKGIYNINAKFSELQAEDSLKRAELIADELKRKSQKDRSIIRRTGKEIAAKQRVAFAAQGIETISGSASDILADTRLLAARDEIELERQTNMTILTARNNAWREAWGYKAQALEYRTMGRFADIASKTKVRNTLLTGGLQTATYGLWAYGKYRGLKELD